MSKERSSRGTTQSAIAVRFVAFLIAAASVLAIPAALIGATIGHVTTLAALLTIAGASVLIATAGFAVRSFDPLRG